MLIPMVLLTGLTVGQTPARQTPFQSPYPLEDMRGTQAVLETSEGTIVIDLLAEAGVYDGVGVHRVAPDFVVQTGAMNFRATPLTVRQQRLVGNLPPEFTNTPNVLGVVSMARGEAPDSGSTSFFICSATCLSLDGNYTAFARAAAGLDVLAAIASVPVDGETPRTPITLIRARVEKRAAPGP